jgi:DNA-binding transcriptional MerR regulator
MQAKISNSTLQIPAKLYRIGELVRYTPFSRQTIHNYTIMGLISEAQWTEGGHRLYDESVFQRLSTIIHLKKTKTLSQIRDILRKESDGAEASRLADVGTFTSKMPSGPRHRQGRPTDTADQPPTRTD